MDKIKISDDDIDHLQKTIERVLEIFMSIKTEFTDSNDIEAINKLNTQKESFKAIKELINADTLKTMQLLGFNYKAAIGEPLTELRADAIKNHLVKNNKPTNQSKRK